MKMKTKTKTKMSARTPGIPLLVFSFLLLVSLAACQKEQHITPITTDTTDTHGDTVARPTWTVAPDYDYSRSMTAVVAVDLSQLHSSWQLDTADLLGAFAGEECLGVAAPTADLFYLYIVAPRESSEAITLRYYSAQQQNIYLADTAFPFENGSRQGTTTTPLTPTWKAQ